MRLVLLIPKLHAGSELAVNRLAKRHDLNIVGIVRSDTSFFKKKYWQYAFYGVRRAGLFYGALIALTIYLPFIGLSLGSLLIWRRRNVWKRVDELAAQHHIPIHDTQNINASNSIKVLKQWKPDVIVSLYFNQILKKEVIEIPKKAALNMHPGLLPKYRGLWPEFWKLHNREKFAGVTLHHINEGIDTGDIIAQVAYPIKKNDTRLSLSFRSSQHGVKMLLKTLNQMKRGIPLKPLRLKGPSRYYSIPTKAHMDAFFARGKRLFSWAGLWREFDRNKH